MNIYIKKKLFTLKYFLRSYIASAVQHDSHADNVKFRFRTQVCHRVVFFHSHLYRVIRLKRPDDVLKK